MWHNLWWKERQSTAWDNELDNDTEIITGSWGLQYNSNHLQVRETFAEKLRKMFQPFSCFSIASGVQSAHHPNPGRAFFAVGFPRLCYLPENQTGRKILRFLKIGFDRGLLFSIGRSATTGREDVVIWKNVEHKTQFSMYPDPNYLQRCMEQLIHLGVTD